MCQMVVLLERINQIIIVHLNVCLAHQIIGLFNYTLRNHSYLRNIHHLSAETTPSPTDELGCLVEYRYGYRSKSCTA